MLSRTCISTWRKVELDVVPGYRIRGTLEMVRYGRQIVLFWCPETIQHVDALNPDPGAYRVAIFLHHVENVTIDSHRMDYGAIDIKFKDGNTFPTLYFTQFGNIAVTHFASYLIEKNFAQPICKCASTIQILSKHSPGSISVPYGYISSSKFLSLYEHWKVLNSLEMCVHENVQLLTEIEFEELNIDDIKTRVMKYGTEDSLRCRVWPVLLGVYPHGADASTKAEIDVKNAELFRNLRNQFELLVEIQQPTVLKIEQSISSDTVWLNDNPDLKGFATEILEAYSQYNRDTGHAEGMNDILVQIIDVVIGRAVNGGTIMDGRQMNRETALGYAFACFVAFIEKNKHNMMFSKPYEMQKISSEQIFGMISKICKPMASWMQLRELTDMMFMYRRILLVYQRDLPRNGLLRLWDSILCSENDGQFLNYFSVTFALLLFVPCITHEISTNGDVLELMNQLSGVWNVQMMIRMATCLERNITLQ